MRGRGDAHFEDEPISKEKTLSTAAWLAYGLGPSKSLEGGMLARLSVEEGNPDSGSGDVSAFDLSNSPPTSKVVLTGSLSCISKTHQSPFPLNTYELPYPHSREREKIGAS